MSEIKSELTLTTQPLTELELLRKKLTFLETVIKSKCDYSFDLVWLARKRPEDLKLLSVKRSIEKIETKYPDKVAELESDDSDWYHGYNSACLALSRLVLGILDVDKQVESWRINHDENQETGSYMTIDDCLKDLVDEYPMLDS